MDFQAFGQTLVIALAVAAISITVSKTHIFDTFRRWVRKRSSWFGELVGCHYCLAHWLCFVGFAIYQPVLITGRWWLADNIVSLFALVATSAIVMWPIKVCITKPHVGGNHAKSDTD